jgi:hypothetical protein
MPWSAWEPSFCDSSARLADRLAFHTTRNSVYTDGAALQRVAGLCARGGVKVVSGIYRLRVVASSAVHPQLFPASLSLRLIELLRVLLVASLLQGSRTRVDHERYGRLVCVVADTVPLALADEHGIALLQARWLAFGEGQA